MRSKYSGWYPKSPAEISALWDVAIFVPDANIMLHCLRHPAPVREELLRLFELLGSSLWVPYQVGLEFHRNRLEVELGARDAYDTLIKDQESIVEKGRDRLRQIRAHPMIDAAKEIAALDMYLADFKRRMEAARSEHPLGEIESAVVRLTKILEGRVGEKWSREQMAALKKEGEDRYARKVPPGYKDAKKDLGEYDRFGDLIIWKEMIAHAKTNGRPIIFVSDDAKEDWWWFHRGRKIGPRPELVEEFREGSEQEFHIYEFSSFLRFAADRHPDIKANVSKVQASLLADEEARRLLDYADHERQVLTTLRALEDEAEQIIGALSGAPGALSHPTTDRSRLRARLEQLNREIADIRGDGLNRATNSVAKDLAPSPTLTLDKSV